MISGNFDGIQLIGAGNTIQRNLIGTNAAGTAAVANTYGVRLPNIGSCAAVTGAVRVSVTRVLLAYERRGGRW